MERLTRWDENDEVECIVESLECNGYCEDCDIREITERLAYYEDEAEQREQGTQLGDDERQSILMAAIDWYGITPQVDMAIEEMAELTKALCKIKRGWSEEAFANIREEIADVQIMLDQMRLIYGQTAEIETAKLARLQRRIRDAQESRSTD